MPYYYENHLGGGYYSSEEELDYEDLYCETCGDSDWPLGYYETEEEFLKEYSKRYEEYDDDEDE